MAARFPTILRIRSHGWPRVKQRIRLASRRPAALLPTALRSTSRVGTFGFRREPMRVFAIAVVLTLVGSAVSAQTGEAGSGATAQTAETCKARASEKKLSGAAMTSFMKKCERDAATTCDASAKDKKLAGA